MFSVEKSGSVSAPLFLLGSESLVFHCGCEGGRLSLKKHTNTEMIPETSPVTYIIQNTTQQCTTVICEISQ